MHACGYKRFIILTLTTPLDPLQAGCSVDEEMQATVPVSGSTCHDRVELFQADQLKFKPERSGGNNSLCWKRTGAN